MAVMTKTYQLVLQKNMHKWNDKNKLIIIKGMMHALVNKQPWLSNKMPNDLLKVVNHTLKIY
ncbi:MAG: hypothetical protein QM499_04890 [Flavobacteriaceae bacterium]